eukprot:TRINITY_DN2078_c2_g2_i1.p1 TRINITY_DN2078_c2_g2~~TRINITY_DN2078_c2_g2_i1.p1  ORF type:complete len:384 (+),score=146.34 TRINITY_DN2078_c2_g2_i1:65-1216(+)
MDASMSFDAMTSLRIGAKPVPDNPSAAKATFQRGVRALIAQQRLATGIFGRKWNDMTDEGQQEIIKERREKRLKEAEERRLIEESHVSMDDVMDTCKGNAHSNSARPRKGELSGVAHELWTRTGDLVNTKAWYLTSESSTPLYNQNAQYPNRKKDTPFLGKDDLLKIGIAYLKLTSLTQTLSQLNEIALERAYTIMQKEEMVPTNKKGMEAVKHWYMEHYNTTESMIFVQSGSCYLDFRDDNGDFVRVHLCQGDLLLCPAHRFFRGVLDQKQQLSMILLFQDENSVVHRELASLDFADRNEIADYTKELSMLPSQPNLPKGLTSPRSYDLRPPRTNKIPHGKSPGKTQGSGKVKKAPTALPPLTLSPRQQKLRRSIPILKDGG